MNPETVLRAYFDGINAERYEDVGALFAPAAEIVAPGANPRGPEEIARYFAAALRPYPVHHDGPGTPYVAGHVVTVEVHFTGALASGTPMEFDALDVFALDGEGRIARLTTWYDSHKVRGDLAAAMAADGSPEARLLLALRSARRGRAQRLEGRWRGKPPLLAARAVRVDVEGPLTADALAAAGVGAGDVALVRSVSAAGSPGATPGGLVVAAEVALAAVAVAGAVAAAPPGLVVGEEWVLDALEPGWQGLLVAQSDHGAVVLS